MSKMRVYPLIHVHWRSLPCYLGGEAIQSYDKYWTCTLKWYRSSHKFLITFQVWYRGRRFRIWINFCRRTHYNGFTVPIYGPSHFLTRAKIWYRLSKVFLTVESEFIRISIICALPGVWNLEIWAQWRSQPSVRLGWLGRDGVRSWPGIQARAHQSPVLERSVKIRKPTIWRNRKKGVPTLSTSLGYATAPWCSIKVFMQHQSAERLT